MESLSSESKSIALDILEDILSAIERLEERTKDVNSIDDFLSSSSGMVLLDATCMLLIAIGESLKNLDKTTQGLLLPTYPSIPWKNVKGLRDIIAHHYFDVDASQILWIIKNEISPLKDAIRFFIKNLNDPEQVEKKVSGKPKGIKICPRDWIDNNYKNKERRKWANYVFFY